MRAVRAFLVLTAPIFATPMLLAAPPDFVVERSVVVHVGSAGDDAGAEPTRFVAIDQALPPVLLATAEIGNPLEPSFAEKWQLSSMLRALAGSGEAPSLSTWLRAAPRRGRLVLVLVPGGWGDGSTIVTQLDAEDVLDPLAARQPPGALAHVRGKLAVGDEPPDRASVRVVLHVDFLVSRPGVPPASAGRRTYELMLATQPDGASIDSLDFSGDGLADIVMRTERDHRGLPRSRDLDLDGDGVVDLSWIWRDDGDRGFLTERFDAGADGTIEHEGPVEIACGRQGAGAGTGGTRFSGPPRILVLLPSSGPSFTPLAAVGTGFDPSRGTIPHINGIPSLSLFDISVRPLPLVGSVSVGMTIVPPQAPAGAGDVTIEHMGQRSNPFPFTKN